MLLFYGVSASEIKEVKKKGLRGKVKLYRSLDKVIQKEPDYILVIDPLELDKDIPWNGKEVIKVSNVPPKAIVNLNPYLPPSNVVAGGGYVTRPGKDGIELLMIYRRGAWDLPKGKQDEGEDEVECALREVREEVGIAVLNIGQALGTTVHGYERKGKYKVKTTYWYEMHTPETKFTPQSEEDIERVHWMPWSKAVRKIGYETFRRHMKSVAPLLGA